MSVAASVVVVTYRRLARLGEVLAGWLQETPDVWLCDCSKDGFKTDLPVNIVRCQPDPGLRMNRLMCRRRSTRCSMTPGTRTRSRLT